MKNSCTILELFSGIGGFTLGLQKAGFTFKKHYFSEVDKHAIANYKYNFPNAEYIGSVTAIRGNSITRPDIITFESPCQDFSLAGNRAGLEGERSGLIQEAIRLVAECRPSVFVWENVKGTFSSNNGSDFWAILAAFANLGNYRLEWQLLNTSWVLPQNRERIYLVGHLAGHSSPGVFPFTENDGLFNQKVGYKNIKSQSEICTTIKPQMGNRVEDTFVKVPTIAATLTCGGKSGGLHSDMTTIEIRSANKEGFQKATFGDSINLNHLQSSTQRGRVGKGIVKTLDTACAIGILSRPHGFNQGNNTPISPTIKANSFEHNNYVIGTLRTHNDGNGLRQTQSQLCPTIPARSRKDGSGQPAIKVQAISTPDRADKDQNGRRMKAEGDPQFTLTSNDNHGIVIDETVIRRLTEIECERLQGFPDDWTRFGIYENGKTKEIPKTQRYKLIGNAVTSDIVALIGIKLQSLLTI